MCLAVSMPLKGFLFVTGEILFSALVHQKSFVMEMHVTESRAFVIHVSSRTVYLSLWFSCTSFIRRAYVLIADGYSRDQHCLLWGWSGGSCVASLSRGYPLSFKSNLNPPEFFWAHPESVWDLCAEFYPSSIVKSQRWERTVRYLAAAAVAFKLVESK